MKLLCKVAPYPDETLAGYILRLAQINHYSSAKLIIDIAGLQSKTRAFSLNLFYTYKHDLSKLCEITGLSENILWSMAFCKKYNYQNGIEGFGELFSSALLNHGCFSICSACLQEKYYYRQIWDLNHVRVCPFHKCYLINACPMCHQKINMSFSQLSQCKNCRFVFHNWIERASLSDFLLSAYVYNKLNYPGIYSVFGIVLDRLKKNRYQNKLLYFLKADPKPLNNLRQVEERIFDKVERMYNRFPVMLREFGLFQ